MKIKVRVHIGNKSMQRGDAHPFIQIEDVSSGIRIGEISFTPANFGELVAGSGFIEGEMDAVGSDCYENVGRKKDVSFVQIPKSAIKDFGYGKSEAQSAFIDNLMMHSEYLPDGQGWMVWDNGTRSQQPGDSHRVVYYRFVDIAAQSLISSGEQQI